MSFVKKSFFFFLLPSLQASEHGQLANFEQQSPSTTKPSNLNGKWSEEENRKKEEKMETH